MKLHGLIEASSEGAIEMISTSEYYICSMDKNSFL